MFTSFVAVSFLAVSFLAFSFLAFSRFNRRVDCLNHAFNISSNCASVIVGQIFLMASEEMNIYKIQK